MSFSNEFGLSLKLEYTNSQTWGTCETHIRNKTGLEISLLDGGNPVTIIIRFGGWAISDRFMVEGDIVSILFL